MKKILFFISFSFIFIFISNNPVYGAIELPPTSYTFSNGLDDDAVDIYTSDLTTKDYPYILFLDSKTGSSYGTEVIISSVPLKINLFDEVDKYGFLGKLECDGSDILGYQQIINFLGSSKNRSDYVELRVRNEGIIYANYDVFSLDGELFFFQTHSGPYLPPDEEPEPTPTPIPSGLDDEDRGWLSGLFSGITESITNVAGTIIDGVVGAFQTVGQFILDGIKDLFLPSDGFFSDKIDGIKDKFSFVDNIKDAFDDILLVLEDTTEEVPNISINLSNAEGKYNYGDTALALDMSWYARFKPFVDVIIIAFSYFSFIWVVFKNLPNIIRGESVIYDYNHRVKD